MKLAGNRVRHLVDFFHSELDPLYGTDETDAILSLVFEHFVGFKRNEVCKRAEENLNQSDLLKIYFCCKYLKKGKPLQYILNEAWFYGLKFYVNEHVLIPRPETEELVDLILKENRSCSSLLDAGTGSGCIPVCVKHKLPGCGVVGVDISGEALKVARENAAKWKVEIQFFEADVLQTKSLVKLLNRDFEIIVSNPPYVKRSEKASLHKNVAEHEPHRALFVEGDDDTIFYKRIIDASANLLRKKGKLYFELNPLTADEVKRYALETDMFMAVELVKDMSGKIRFLKAAKK